MSVITRNLICLRSKLFISITLLAVLLSYAAYGQSQSTLPALEDIDRVFVAMLVGESTDVAEDIALIESNWQPEMIPMALEVIVYSRNQRVIGSLINILESKTDQQFGKNIDAWYRWLWSQPEQRHPHYARFKSNIYKNMDPRFEFYFADDRETDIRLDEIRWGGVVQDGIPPLRSPEMITVSEAEYLADTDIIFGIAQGDDIRAYPKRILAWHEMFVDQVNETAFAGVYCTLCGMVILYDTRFDGVTHAIGTSGFLYRSNKLMYDQDTQSLWSTTRGEPVVGPLVGRGIRLTHSFVVTTTWGEWRRRHPETMVLSLNTGHQRNYGEGVAYERYFASDELMFTVPETDERLANKAEILALRFPEQTDKTAAISADFLIEKPVFHYQLGPQKLVVLTDPSGANRVFDAPQTEFVNYDGDSTVTDTDGVNWTLTEALLTSEKGETLARLPAHRAFWFGWHAVYTDTELVN